MDVFIVAEKLAYILRMAVTATPVTILGKGFQLDFCPGGISAVITDAETLPAIKEVLGEPEAGYRWMTGFGEYKFSLPIPAPSLPPKGAVLRKSLSEGIAVFECGRLGYKEDASSSHSQYASRQRAGHFCGETWFNYCLCAVIIKQNAAN